MLVRITCSCLRCAQIVLFRMNLGFASPLSHLRFILSQFLLILLIKGRIEGPLQSERHFLALNENLISHGFPCEFCVKAVRIFDESVPSLLIEVDVFNLAPRREVFIQKSDHVFLWHVLLQWLVVFFGLSAVQSEAIHEQSATLLTEWTNALQVIFVCRVTHPSKHILDVVQLALNQIFFLWNSVVVPTIDALCAGSTRKKHTEVAGLLRVKVVRFGIAGVNLGETASQRYHPLVTLSFVSRVLVIPNVVVGGTPLLIRYVFSTLLHLFARRPLHPLMHLILLQFLHFIHFTLLFFLFFLWDLFVWLILNSFS